MMMIDENKNEMRRHRDVCFQDLDGKEEKNARRDGGKQQLGLGQLWRSLPKSCKIFLVVCVVQACVAGAFSVVELCKGVVSNLQDLVLLLVSSIFFLLLVLDAFYHENAYQLLVSMASGGINLAQLIVYATSLNAGRDSTSITVAVVCAILQVITLALTRWAYLGFGWRMYSKIAGDMRLPNIEHCRRASLRMDRFVALAKLDVQLMVLLLIVGIINGVNPGSGSWQPSLLVAATVGVTAVALWLGLCCYAVTFGKPKLALVAEFSHPCSYIVAAAYMFSSVYYGDRLLQLHGQAYLLAFPIIFLIGRTGVWWDARLLSGSDLAIIHRDLYAKMSDSEKNGGPMAAPGNIWRNKTFGDIEFVEGEFRPVFDGAKGAESGAKIPSALLPLVRGSWLLKLSSQETGGLKTSSKSLQKFLGTFEVRKKGRWRFFQLSHDGSTLRWDWRKYVLLMHVESVNACPEDLTINLAFTLEPDLRLKCPDAETHQQWARGLTLVVMLLGNPDGLSGKAAAMNDVYASAAADPYLSSRLLSRLTSASLRASAAGRLTKEALKMAAVRARKAFSDQSRGSGDNGIDQDEISIPRDHRSISITQQDIATISPFTVQRSSQEFSLLRRPSRNTLHNCDPAVSNLVDAFNRSGSLRGIAGGTGFSPCTVHEDVELGHPRRSCCLENQQSALSTSPRALSIASCGDSPVKVLELSKKYENLAFEGRRGSFSRVQANGKLGSTYSPSSDNGQPVSRSKRNSSPLRRAGGIDAYPDQTAGHDAATINAPHFDIWQQKFDSDAYMAEKSSTEGSPSIMATPKSPLSHQKSVLVNVELIDFKQLIFGKMLGQGAEGPVFAAWFHETPVAVKRVSSQEEIDIHLHAGWHDNIVNLRGLAHHRNHSYLVMELCPRGTLDMLIHKGVASTQLDPKKILPIARSIARGMLHLHRRLPPIFHRDLKPGNIFIGHGFVMKIGDFGMARYAVDRPRFQPQAGTNFSRDLGRTLTTGVIGTAAYCAPEVLSPQTPKDKGRVDDASAMLKADVYSFGVTLWELLERQRPFDGMDGFQIQTQWFLDPESMRFEAPSIPSGLDNNAKQIMEALCGLVTSCTSWNPEDRPDFHEILSIIKSVGPEGGGSPIKNQHLASPFCG